MKSRKKHAIQNFSFGLISKIISILLPFVTRSILIYTLGNNFVGLGSLFTAILQVLNLLELGFGSAIVFNLYKPLAEKNEAKVRAYINAYRKIYKIIGFTVLIIGLAITPFVQYLIKDYENFVNIGINIRVIFLFYLVNMSMTYLLYAYKECIFGANLRSDISYKIGAVVEIIQVALAIVSLLVFKNYYLYVMTMLIGTLIKNLIINIVFNKKYSNFSPQGEISAEEKKSLKQNIIDLFGGKLSTVFFNTFDSIIISVVLGSNILGLYNNYYIIMNSIYGITIIFSSSIVNIIGNKIATASVNENYIVFKRIDFLFKFIVALFTICLVCLYPHFMKLWLKDEEMLFGFGYIILFGLYFYFFTIRNIICIYKDAAGLWHSDRIRPYIEGVCNITLNIILIYLIGLPGILIATIATMAFMGNPWLVRSFFKDYFKRNESDYFFSHLYNFTIMTLCGVATFFVCSLLPSVGILAFLGKVAICAVMPTLLLLLLNFKTLEFKYYTSLIRDFLKGKKISLSKIFSSKKRSD